MITYLLKRMLAMIPTLVGISLLTFLIVLLAPGDPVDTKMGKGTGPQASDGGGGNDDPAQRADAIKAKKKLLGMMEELRAVVVWDGVAAFFAEEAETIAIPPEQNVISTVAVGILGSTKHPKQAARFVKFLTSDEGLAILKKHGYATRLPQ